MLGSRKKAKTLFDQLESEGIDSAEFRRVFVPAGLDIGSETPEEIAVSIVAELIAARKKTDLRLIKDSLRCAGKPDARQ